jgi:hypothetical protein
VGVYGAVTHLRVSNKDADRRRVDGGTKYGCSGFNRQGVAQAIRFRAGAAAKPGPLACRGGGAGLRWRIAGDLG